ncbi:type III secretion system inner membrane ring lipoprotein SctJ [Candidatus Glomeribacter gigasporarum]|uniref:type III secretion system inner membrane ring lipoprotein SctJ n=1 Tax=Candidatus Glomeribacter gigasporarum TaxID=132144 RepID=UPI0002E52571|nr:type III secretion inner membrane ring lipoprotein SctJ [Candidatus Glomeribacter gigasporarum]
MRFVEHFSVIFPVSLRARSLGKSLKNALVVYLLLLSALLAGCKVTLYSDLTESEANQMLALLMMNRISAAKQQNKAGALTLQVEKTQFIQAVEVLRQNGYPRPKYASVMDVFPSNQFISSPEQEKAKMNYLKEQRLESMLMNIDGVIVARVSIGAEPADSLGIETVRPTASVFIKYSPAMNLSTWQGQIRDLVRQGVAGIQDDHISVVMAPASYRYTPSQAQQAMQSWWVRLVQHPLWFGGLAAAVFALLVVAAGFSIWNARRAS